MNSFLKFKKHSIALAAFTQILLSSFFTTSYSAESCKDLFQNSQEVAQQKLAHRYDILQTNHILSPELLLNKLADNGLLIFKGNHKYEPGTEFLASNEFDWSRTPIDHTPTDLVVGFGTNVSWDIALRKKAKFIAIGDWSPWPVISQAYLVSPLMRISETPAEFILMLSGIPKQYAKNLSVAEAFSMARQFSSTGTNQQGPIVKSLLIELANNNTISEIELKFLTTYFRPRMGDNLSPYGFGPFHKLRSPGFALLNGFYSDRYNPQAVGAVESVFSSQENFNYLRSMFKENKVIYGVTSVTDTNFYQAIEKFANSNKLSKLTFSITNIFDCGCYNGLTFKDLQAYMKTLSQKFSYLKTPLVFFRTTSHSPPHGFYRYEVESEGDIPKADEKDSTAITEKERMAGSF